MLHNAKGSVPDVAGHAEAVQVITQGARERAEAVREAPAALKAEGVMPAQGIARTLNERGVVTARRGAWTARSVLNVVARLSQALLATGNLGFT